MDKSLKWKEEEGWGWKYKKVENGKKKKRYWHKNYDNKKDENKWTYLKSGGGEISGKGENCERTKN